MMWINDGDVIFSQGLKSERSEGEVPLAISVPTFTHLNTYRNFTYAPFGVHVTLIDYRRMKIEKVQFREIPVNVEKPLSYYFLLFICRPYSAKRMQI